MVEAVVSLLVEAVAGSAVSAGLRKLVDLVRGKLSGDPALAKLEEEAAESSEVSDRTRQRVQLALEDAVEEDPDFATQLRELLAELQATHAQGGVTASNHGVAIGGDVRADRGGIAISGVTGGTVSFGQQPGPSEPGRTQS